MPTASVIVTAERVSVSDAMTAPQRCLSPPLPQNAPPSAPPRKISNASVLQSYSSHYTPSVGYRTLENSISSTSQQYSQMQQMQHLRQFNSCRIDTSSNSKGDSENASSGFNMQALPVQQHQQQQLQQLQQQICLSANQLQAVIHDSSDDSLGIMTLEKLLAHIITGSSNSGQMLLFDSLLLLLPSITSPENLMLLFLRFLSAPFVSSNCYDQNTRQLQQQQQQKMFVFSLLSHWYQSYVTDFLLPGSSDCSSNFGKAHGLNQSSNHSNSSHQEHMNSCGLLLCSVLSCFPPPSWTTNSSNSSCSSRRNSINNNSGIVKVFRSTAADFLLLFTAFVAHQQSSSSSKDRKSGSIEGASESLQQQQQLLSIVSNAVDSSHIEELLAMGPIDLTHQLTLLQHQRYSNLFGSDNSSGQHMRSLANVHALKIKVTAQRIQLQPQQQQQQHFKKTLRFLFTSSNSSNSSQNLNNNKQSPQLLTPLQPSNVTQQQLKNPQILQNLPQQIPTASLIIGWSNSNSLWIASTILNCKSNHHGYKTDSSGHCRTSSSEHSSSSVSNSNGLYHSMRRMLVLWLKAAEHCASTGNFVLLFEIVIAVSMQCVHRLYSDSSNSSNNQSSSMNSESCSRSKDINDNNVNNCVLQLSYEEQQLLQELTRLISPRNNYGSYRQLLWDFEQQQQQQTKHQGTHQQATTSATATALYPYFGVVLKDLTTLTERYSGLSSTNSSISDDNKYHKYNSLATTTANTEELQRHKQKQQQQDINNPIAPAVAAVINQQHQQQQQHIYDRNHRNSISSNKDDDSNSISSNIHDAEGAVTAERSHWLVQLKKFIMRSKQEKLHAKQQKQQQQQLSPNASKHQHKLVTLIQQQLAFDALLWPEAEETAAAGLFKVATDCASQRRHTAATTTTIDITRLLALANTARKATCSYQSQSQQRQQSPQLWMQQQRSASMVMQSESSSNIITRNKASSVMMTNNNHLSIYEQEQLQHQRHHDRSGSIVDGATVKSTTAPHWLLRCIQHSRVSITELNERSNRLLPCAASLSFVSMRPRSYSQ